MTQYPPVPTAAWIAAEVRAGRRTAREFVELALARIAAHDDRIRAFTRLRADEARAEAGVLDAGGPGRDGLLAGVPVAVKDAFDVAGMVTTNGGLGYTTPASQDGAVVQRLRAAGAVVVGRTAMPEFGQFPMTESLAHGRTHNPWDPTRSAGGSSGGSAAAVAAGMVPVAAGSDGGGSIRVPASCCGLVGLKPGTTGSVPTGTGRQHPSGRDAARQDDDPQGWFGLVVAGALTRTVTDQAIVALALAEPPPTGPARQLAELLAEPDRLRIGWTLDPVHPGLRLPAAVSRACAGVAGRLGRLGHRVSRLRVRWPNPAAGFFARFLAGMAAEARAAEHPELLEPRTRSTARMGAWVPPWLAAWGRRNGRQIAARLERLFDDWDVLMLPTMCVEPPPLGQLDGFGSARSMRSTEPLIANTALFNHSGHPVLAVPAGLGRSGLPIGVQLVGRFGSEALLLRLAAQLERRAPWPGLAPAFRRA